MKRKSLKYSTNGNTQHLAVFCSFVFLPCSRSCPEVHPCNQSPLENIRGSFETDQWAQSSVVNASNQSRAPMSGRTGADQSSAVRINGHSAYFNTRFRKYKTLTVFQRVLLAFRSGSLSSEWTLTVTVSLYRLRSASFTRV